MASLRRLVFLLHFALHNLSIYVQVETNDTLYRTPVNSLQRNALTWCTLYLVVTATSITMCNIKYKQAGIKYQHYSDTTWCLIHWQCNFTCLQRPHVIKMFLSFSSCGLWLDCVSIIYMYVIVYFQCVQNQRTAWICWRVLHLTDGLEYTVLIIIHCVTAKYNVRMVKTKTQPCVCFIPQ